MEETLRQLYLDIMKRCLLGLIYEDEPVARFDTVGLIASFFSREKFEFNPSVREAGLDWPSQAHSMIGLERMNNLQYCVEQVIQNKIPGDLIETGVWRGGAVIFMRAILQAYSIRNRQVWAADSFVGLPVPNAKKYPQDRGVRLDRYTQLSVSLETVKTNFQRYNLLDEQVRFLKGWFRDTLPTAPITQLAVLRLDGDLYESTHDALTYLYPKVAVGGYIIIDDYSLWPCQRAVKDYRARHAITDEIQPIDGRGVFWQRKQ